MNPYSEVNASEKWEFNSLNEALNGAVGDRAETFKGSVEGMEVNIFSTSPNFCGILIYLIFLLHSMNYGVWTSKHCFGSKCDQADMDSRTTVEYSDLILLTYCMLSFMSFVLF